MNQLTHILLTILFLDLFAGVVWFGREVYAQEATRDEIACQVPDGDVTVWDYGRIPEDTFYPTLTIFEDGSVRIIWAGKVTGTSYIFAAPDRTCDEGSHGAICVWHGCGAWIDRRN